MYVCDMSMQLLLKHSYPPCIKCITLMFAANIINQTSVNVKVYYEVTECSLRGVHVALWPQYLRTSGIGQLM